MREPKTKPEKASVSAFLNAIPDEARRKDCRAVARLMQQATGSKPQMWGTSIVGFGNRTYRGASGETAWFLAGFSPRKQNLTLYLVGGTERHAALLGRLGKHKTGGSCLYLKSLADVDLAVLKLLIEESLKGVQESRSLRV